MSVKPSLAAAVCTDFAPMPGGVVPNDHDVARPPSVIQPARDGAVPFEDPKNASREAWRLCAIRTVASKYDPKQPTIEQKNAFERKLRTYIYEQIHKNSPSSWTFFAFSLKQIQFETTNFHADYKTGTQTHSLRLQCS